MSKKQNRRVESLWQKLREQILQIEDNQTDKLLNALKHWLLEHKKLLSADFSKHRAALSLLLDGKASQFPLDRPILAAKVLKHLVSHPFLVPRNMEEMADTLETAIREFAVFTNWEDCPVCQEGYLGYWIEPYTKTFVLCCPECWRRQNLNGQEWVDLSPLLPASVQELSMLGITITPREQK